MPDTLYGSEEILHWDETDAALAKFAARCDLGLQFVIFPEEKMLTDCDFAAGSNQTLPFVRILADLFCEENFDASAEEIARCRIAQAERLRLQSSAAAVEACGKHPRIVENDEVIGAEQIGEIAEMTIFEGSGFCMEMQ